MGQILQAGVSSPSQLPCLLQIVEDDRGCHGFSHSDIYIRHKVPLVNSLYVSHTVSGECVCSASVGYV